MKKLLAAIIYTPVWIFMGIVLAIILPIKYIFAAIDWAERTLGE